MFNFSKGGYWNPSPLIAGHVPWRVPSILFGVDGFAQSMSWARRVQRFLSTHALLILGYDQAILPKYEPAVLYAWQEILDFLYREGAIATPVLQQEVQSYGNPHLYLASLQARFNQGATDGLPDTTLGRFARGASVASFNEALSKMLGEFLERYPLLYYKEKDFLRASTAHLKGKKLHHVDLTFFPTPTQQVRVNHKKMQWDTQTVFQWVSGTSLHSKKTVLLPAQLIFWNYQTRAEEARIAESSTNGAAGMFTKEEAIFSGLAELLQRDAFLNHWLTHTPPKRIHCSSIQSLYTKELLAHCARYQLEVVLLDTTLDTSLFTSAAFIFDRSGKGPAVVCGGGGGVNSEEAVLKSLTEALGVRIWLADHTKESAVRKGTTTTLTSPLDRSLFWAPLSMIEEVSWICGGEEIDLKPSLLETHSVKESLSLVVAELKEKGKPYEVFVYSAEHSLLKKLGYHGVKVVVPALTPLYFTEQYAPLASKRIEMLQEKGLLKKGVLNTTPHPFP